MSRKGLIPGLSQKCEGNARKRYSFYRFLHSFSALVFFSVLFRSFPYFSAVEAHPLVITFTGDILLDRGVRHRIETLGLESIFSPEVDSLLLASDIVVGNLECPATKIHAPAFKRFVFRAEPEWLDALRRHGFTHLNLANNHSVDQGRRGLEDTFRQVIIHGMTPMGAAPTADEATQPFTDTFFQTRRQLFILPTLRLPLEHFFPLPSAWSVSQEADTTLLYRIRHLRRTHPRAVIIVTPHWGWEHHTRPEPRQRLFARALIDAGADIVIGHHPHTMQTIENYRGRYIYYSIGNFIFDQQRPLNTEACMVRLTITPDTMHVTTIPLTIRNFVPHVATFLPRLASNSQKHPKNKRPNPSPRRKEDKQKPKLQNLY